MNLTPLTDRLSVSAQILPQDMAQLQALGVKSIICNRPDGEDTAQPTFEMIRAAAKHYGIEARYIPITPGQMTQNDVIAFDKALSALEGPVVAFCRSGARSANLFAAWQAEFQPASA